MDNREYQSLTTYHAPLSSSARWDGRLLNTCGKYFSHTHSPASASLTHSLVFAHTPTHTHTCPRSLAAVVYIVVHAETNLLSALTLILANPLRSRGPIPLSLSLALCMFARPWCTDFVFVLKSNVPKPYDHTHSTRPTNPIKIGGICLLALTVSDTVCVYRNSDNSRTEPVAHTHPNNIIYLFFIYSSFVLSSINIIIVCCCCCCPLLLRFLFLVLCEFFLVLPFLLLPPLLDSFAYYVKWWRIWKPKYDTHNIEHVESRARTHLIMDEWH